MKLKKSLICFQDRLGLEGDILTDNLHPLPGSRRRSKSPGEAGKGGGGGASTDLYLLPGTAQMAEADYEAETEDPLLECNLILKEETEEIYIKSEPAD